MKSSRDIFLRISAFAVCALFVIFFVAAGHDRIMRSQQLLAGNVLPDDAGREYVFRIGFPGFSAFSCQLVSPRPPQTGALDLEMRQGAGPAVIRETVPDVSVLAEKPLRFHFPAAGPGEWRLTLRSRDRQFIRSGCLLRCTFYAGKIPAVRYWYAVAAAGLFFLVLALLEYLVRPVQGNALPAGPKRRKPDFDFGIHYFRAFAILFILILHYRFITPSFRHIGDTLFSSASYFFVFISGYLFYYLNRRFETQWTFSAEMPFLHIRAVSGAFSTTGYYRKKLLNILLPYCLISALLYFYILGFSDETQFTPSVPDFLPDFLFRLGTGAVQQSYWYIYFIAKVFLISPLLLYLPRKWFSVLTFASCALPFVFDRSSSHFLYFLPMYLLGIWYAANREAADRFLFRKPVMTICVLLTAAGLFRLYHLDMERQAGTVFLTRLLMVVLLLYATSLLRRKNIPFLDRCAELSFTFFFIHDFVYAYLKTPLIGLCQPLIRICPAFELLVLAGLVAAVIILAMALKCLFGRFSRQMIGS